MAPVALKEKLNLHVGMLMVSACLHRGAGAAWAAPQGWMDCGQEGDLRLRMMRGVNENPGMATRGAFTHHNTLSDVLSNFLSLGH